MMKPRKVVTGRAVFTPRKGAGPGVELLSLSQKPTFLCFA